MIVVADDSSFVIRKISPPTEDELMENKLSEVEHCLADTDWLWIRETERMALNRYYAANKTVLEYRKYLRDFDKQPDKWWELEVVHWGEWKNAY
jgi:hypothetical protein